MSRTDGPIEYSYSDCVETVTEIANIGNRIQSMYDVTINELKRVDSEICDIEHATEFYNLSASQGYKIYKMLHDARIRRREIKNRLHLLQWIRDKKVSGINGDNLNRKLTEIDNQQYRPRVLKELFNV